MGWVAPSRPILGLFFKKRVARHSSSHGCAHRHAHSQAYTSVHSRPLSTLRYTHPRVHAHGFTDQRPGQCTDGACSPNRAFGALPLPQTPVCLKNSWIKFVVPNHPELQWVSRRDLGENTVQVWILGSLAQLGQKRSPGGFPKREQMSPSGTRCAHAPQICQGALWLPASE